jgi:hypothetical protein
MKMIEVWADHVMGSIPSQVAALLILSLLFWAAGIPLVINQAKAAAVSNFSDTLTDSNFAALTKHVIAFTTSTSTAAGQTLKIQLDPVGSLFSEFYSSATTTDITVTGFTEVADAAACSVAANEAYPTASYNNGTDENLTFTVCPSDTIAAGSIVITVGAVSRLWTNPVSPGGSFRIVLGGSGPNTGETRVAVLSNVTLTASVNTSFTFTVVGLVNGTNVNGENTTIDTSGSATTLPFGTLASGTPQILGQKLTVSTNANNGFAVTVVENQPPTSGTGAIIYLFKDGATTSVPTVWTRPRGVLDARQTYGHFGITSDDQDEGAGEWVATSTTPYAGNIITPRTIFSHTGPADGTTQNKGLAKVAYKIEITDLQAAGNDYTNTLTYVATPTF